MRSPLRSHQARWLVISLVVASILACSVTQATPVTLGTEGPPQAIHVTQLKKDPLFGATVIVPITQIVRPTQIVEVTREVTREVVVVKTVIVEIDVPATAPIPQPAKTEVVVEPLPVWYDFEGDFLASGIIEDRSGNGHDAQVKGSVDSTEGISDGQAIYFSGDGYILAQRNPAAGRNKISFSLWFKTIQPTNNYKFASAAWWHGGPASGWVLATHIPEFWSEDTKSLFIPGSTNVENDFPAGEWVHEVVTYDGQRIREYTNGQLVNDWPATGAAIGMGEPMVVGGWPDTGFFFEGAIDEFRIFDQILSPQEIQTLYNQR